MEKYQLKGKYIPDKNGKLRHTLNPIGMNVRCNLFFSTRSASWYRKIWLWVTNNIL